MDDTQQSRTSDAAATRKRRSSILKSQRPARTPFSELEFNVATPTDTAKSRRVSFSRRTGVAEFVTNEATTTWKNFYEEHNKSLESSGNDSELNAPRQPIEHLGRRIFDQQFEEVEAVDFVGNLTPALSANASLNNINFTQQIESVETADGKLTAPHNKFELSALTDQQSKLFGNDFTVTGVGELSGKIDFNFSNIQHIGERDDLEEIERDLERVATNVVCQGPVDRHNISEYIEVDLNMTHGAKNDDCDMSITDTVSSPKVQDASKSSSIDKKANLEKDWMTDKENIVVNPYAAPREADNFVVNDEPNQVLVFDGKRLTIQTEQSDNRHTILPNTSKESHLRKTIVLNTNDDLPNFRDDANLKSDTESRPNTANHDRHDVCVQAVHKVELSQKKIIHDYTGNISITQSLPTNIISDTHERNESKVHKEIEADNISITQSLKGQIITANNNSIGRRRTVVYENETGNISITQALPTNILQHVKPDKRKTIVFDEDGGNISITQGLTSQIILDKNTADRRKTIVFDDDNANISITQALPSQVILNQKVPEKRKTIVFDDESGNISITQALPTNIVLEKRLEKRKTIIYEDNTGNISITQAAPTNLILAGNLGATERRRTIVYEDDTGNISVTQALPQNIILGKTELAESTQIFDASNISMTQALPTNIILKDSGTNKRRTIVYDDDTGNISITQAIPSQLLTEINSTEKDSASKDDYLKPSTSVTTDTVYRRRTVIYDDEASDISMTQAIPTNIIITNQGEVEKEQNEYTYKEETIVFEDDMCEVSSAEEVPANVFLLSGMKSSSDDERVSLTGEDSEGGSEEAINREISTQVFENPDDDVTGVEKRRTVVFADENCETEVSIMEALPQFQNDIQESCKKQDIDKSTNLYLKNPIPDELVAAIRTNILNKSVEKIPALSEQPNVSNQNQNVIVYQTVTSNSLPSLNKTEQEDSNSAIPIDCESNATTSSKAGETDVTESLSSKNTSVLSQLPSKDHAGHVIEQKAEIFDIKMNVPEKESLTTHSIASNPINVETSKTSVLHNLLDMSEPKSSDIDNKSAGTNFDPLPAEPESKASKESSMLYLIIDEDEEVQTDKIECDKDAESIENESDTSPSIRNSPLSIEYKEQEDSEQEEQEQTYHLRNTLTELVENRDKIVEEKSSRNASISDDKDEDTSRFRSIKEANDTKELLDMICDFTDNSRCSSKEATSPIAIENKAEEIQEPKRFSFATKRQSIIISREDLLNNISMAQAILQKSRIQLDDSSLSEDKQDSSLEDKQESSPENNQDSRLDCANVSKKSARFSNEVVKTLNFDDDTVSENSLKTDFSKISPLKKKTTFGETSFAKENNSTRVIPSYLKDVSDGIKHLMSDLVKPLSDAIPFENFDDKRLKKSMSTVSTQIQANLITSSQIDVDAELSSDPDSRENIDNIPYFQTRNSILISDPVQSSDDASEMFSKINVARKSAIQAPCLQQGSPGHVLVFDHNNPLNNILLGPLDYKHAHDYQPMHGTAIENLVKKSDETLCGSDRSESCQINMEIDSSSDAMSITAKDVEVNTETIVAQFCTAVHGRHENRLFHKPTSKDRAVDVHSEVENTEVNTVIAMKPNKELLGTSSSLTLIEDALSETVAKSESISGSSQYFIAKKKERKSSLVKTEEPAVGTDITTTDDDMDRMKSKGKKRSHIPVTPNTSSSIDTTPKPNSKMLKISESPNPNRILLHMSHEPTKIPAERDVEGFEAVANDDKTEKKANRSYNSSITIQQLLTEYQIDLGTNKEILDVLKDTEYCKSGSVTSDFSSKSGSVTSDSIDKVCSFTSSKNHGSMKHTHSVAASQKSQSTIQSSECARLDWHPELSTLAATKDVTYYDSGVNIVSKIDMLPFMGSYECERESSLGDTWSFRLLHGRIRLTVRLAHRHDNATRTRVRADTPVTHVSVDTIEYDKKNPVAILCIRFACETMRYMVSSSCESQLLARDVPLLLRRCAAVARVALRWGRAMHDAKLHLAYTLDTEGHLALKVANIPLRSVWEVNMDLELVVEHPTQAPWPRAGNVRVNRVVSDVPVSDEDVRQALKHTPNDWGHAPKTLWRMFRYLKHRQRDDNELLMGV